VERKKKLKLRRVSISWGSYNFPTMKTRSSEERDGWRQNAVNGQGGKKGGQSGGREKKGKERRLNRIQTTHQLLEGGDKRREKGSRLHG